MVEVSELNLVEEPDTPETRVWVSEEVRCQLDEADENFLAKLRRYSKNGFGAYTGKKRKPIRPEGNGVYRIGDGSRFRAMGFFDGKDFIIVGCCKKRGKKLGGKCTKLVNKCAKMKKDKQWKRA